MTEKTPTRKPTSTFEVDSSELQLDFLDACKRQGSNMTREVNKFMKSYVDKYKLSKKNSK